MMAIHGDVITVLDKVRRRRNRESRLSNPGRSSRAARPAPAGALPPPRSSALNSVERPTLQKSRKAADRFGSMADLIFYLRRHFGESLVEIRSAEKPDRSRNRRVPRGGSAIISFDCAFEGSELIFRPLRERSHNEIAPSDRVRLLAARAVIFRCLSGRLHSRRHTERKKFRALHLTNRLRARNHRRSTNQMPEIADRARR